MFMRFWGGGIGHKALRDVGVTFENDQYHCEVHDELRMSPSEDLGAEVEDIDAEEVAEAEVDYGYDYNETAVGIDGDGDVDVEDDDDDPDDDGALGPEDGEVQDDDGDLEYLDF
jgi:hypothetical protein